MYKNKRILALIPARGGSKGLPGKNFMPFCGKPLLVWSIEQAKRSQFIDLVVVSTDSRKIAGIAKKFGAEAPFLRPKRISGSRAKTVDAIFHAIDFLSSHDAVFDYIVLLQPTSPLRTEQDIDKAIKALFLNKRAKAVVSVCPVEHHPFWMNLISKNGSMKNFLVKKVINKNRQGLPPYYRLNGALYIASVDFLKKNKTFFGEATYAYVMPLERSTDIDNSIDFELAEILMKKRKG